SDPQRAADMANAYLDLLDKINRKLNITQAKRKRLFLENRLKQVREGLEQAETILREFQEKNNIVSIQEQAKAAIKGAAEIKGQLIAAQTELEVFRKFGTEKQIEAVMLKAKIDGLHKQLDSIEKGKKITQLDSNPAATDHESDIYIPFDDLPHLGTQLMRLTRDAKIQAKLFELLNSQYEIARIEEAKNINSLQILDPAVPPEKKSGPRRRAIVVASVLTALLFSVLLAFFLENNGRFRNITP
ncbi:MAG: GNVR domain-containing protein, partial [Desulfobacteraceae bacterium]